MRGKRRCKAGIILIVSAVRQSRVQCSERGGGGYRVCYKEGNDLWVVVKRGEGWWIGWVGCKGKL